MNPATTDSEKVKINDAMTTYAASSVSMMFRPAPIGSIAMVLLFGWGRFYPSVAAWFLLDVGSSMAAVYLAKRLLRAHLSGSHRPSPTAMRTALTVHQISIGLALAAFPTPAQNYRLLLLVCGTLIGVVAACASFAADIVFCRLLLALTAAQVSFINPLSYEMTIPAKVLVSFAIFVGLMPVFEALHKLVERNVVLTASNTKLLDDLQFSNAQLSQQVRSDPLTGVGNRFELEVSLRKIRPVGFLYIDIDNFKEINDRFGHEGGDVVLCHAAQAITEAVRPNDVVVRLGGDEFAVLLEGANEETAQAIAARVCEFTEGKLAEWGATVSIGASTADLVNVSADMLRSRADEMLYTAKRSGRNQYAFG